MPHSESERQVVIDGTTIVLLIHELHRGINPKEAAVGWCVEISFRVPHLHSGYKRSIGSNLDSNSALIQNLYSQETTPLQADHSTIDIQLGEISGTPRLRNHSYASCSLNKPTGCASIRVDSFPFSLGI